MVNFKDRRAGSPDREARRGDGGRETEGFELRADGSIRRPGSGGRTFEDFFDPKRFTNAVTRADFINVMSQIEFSRRESTWWRSLWRRLRGVPRVANVGASLARAHQRSLEQIAQDMEARGMR